MDKKDIVWISPVYPEPATDGNRLRNYNLIKNVADYFNIHLVSYIDRREPVRLDGMLSKVCRTIHNIELNAEDASFLRRSLYRLDESIRLRPKFCQRKEERKLENTLKTVLKDFPILCIVSASPWVATPFLLKTRIPRILDEQNVEHVLLKNLFDIEKNWLRRISRFLDYAVMYTFEKKALGYFNAVTVASEEDAVIFKKLNHRQRYVVVPNGVDLTYWEYRHKEPDNKTLVFSGGMSYFPNVDAMEYFLKDIFPIILKEDGALRFVIAGKSPSGQLRAQAATFDGKVILTGFIEDMREIIYGASVFIAPLRAGSGSRLKILEAMAAGIPVVSTSKGAEGIRVTNGRDILIADTPETFKENVLRLIRNEELRRSLAENARKLVEESYGWKTIANNMQKTIENCISENTRKRL